MKNKKNVPDIRFKGFNEPWIKGSFGEFGYVSMNRRIFKDQTSPTEEIPFYKIGTFGGEPDSYISRKLFEDYKRKYPYPQIGDILISASGSIGRLVEYSGEEEYFQDSNIVWLAHDGRLSNSFLKHLYSIIKWNGLEGSTIKRLYNKNILDTTFMIPNSECESKSIEEQQAIGNYFQNIDRLINTSQTKLDKLRNIKKACLEKMFPRNGSTTPELRFKGFTEEWKEIKVKNLGNVITGNTPSKTEPTFWDGNFIWVTAQDLKNKYINDSILKLTIQGKGKARVIPKNSIIVTCIASIGLNGINNVECATNQQINSIVCDNKYYYEYIYYAFEHRANLLRGIAGQTAVPIINKSTFEDFSIISPKSKIEQERIGNIFKNLDDLIAKTEQQINKLKNIKKACLDKMFVNE